MKRWTDWWAPPAQSQTQLETNVVAGERYGANILWEIPVQLCLRDFLGAGDIVFDIGANIGGVTVALSRTVGLDGLVFAFEANPFLIPRLKDTITVNKAGNVELISRAVWWESKKLLPFYCDQSHYASTSSLFDAGHKSVKVMVETVTVDDFCLQRSVTPHAIKIDVEGAEYDVLLGAKRLLNEKAPILVLEYCAWVPIDRDPLEYLHHLGYVCFDTNLYEQVNRSFYVTQFRSPPLVNILAIPRSRLPATRYNGITIKEHKHVTIPNGTLTSGYIPIEEPGRYIISIDLSGPPDCIAIMTFRNHAGELIAYYEAPISHLQQHICSNVIVDLSAPDELICEIVQGSGCESLTLNGVRLHQIVWGMPMNQKLN